MRKFAFCFIGFFAFSVIKAQQLPVHWQFAVKKISEKAFELHLHAALDEGWHIYAQLQPEGAISLPTKITFVSNPLIQLTGNVTEVGTLEKHRIEKLRIVQNQYSDNVDFVQTFILKSSDVKTSIRGKISYQVCTDEHCLAPMDLPFNETIMLN